MANIFNVALIRKSRLKTIPYWLKEHLCNIGVKIENITPHIEDVVAVHCGITPVKTENNVKKLMRYYVVKDYSDGESYCIGFSRVRSKTVVIGADGINSYYEKSLRKDKLNEYNNNFLEASTLKYVCENTNKDVIFFNSQFI